MGFQTSIMVDTPLNSLAQNLDAPDWPLPGREETPSKYVDLSYGELTILPELSGHPERVAQLISILRETLAFDEPFGEMVAQTAMAVAQENPLQKNLAKLGIPAAYPMEQVAVSAETEEFCRLEKITTLGEFADFAQNMPAQVIVGGDFRALLNALAHVNETALAGFLPFRPGSRGLHLPEALGLLVAALPEGERSALARRYGAALKPEEEKAAAAIDRETRTRAEAALMDRATPVLEWFKGELEELVAKLKAGESLDRHLVVLGDPARERIVAKILEPALQAAGAPMAVGSATDRDSRPGFFSRLFRKK